MLASSCASAACNSEGSSSAINWPFFTSEPSSTVNLIIRPAICGLMITSLPSTTPIRGMLFPCGVNAKNTTTEIITTAPRDYEKLFPGHGRPRLWVATVRA